MVRHFRHGRRNFLCLVLLFFSISAYCRDTAKTLPSSGSQNIFQLYSPEARSVLPDLDGDHTPDFVGGQRLGRTTEGYFYRVQLHLSAGSPSSSFTVFHDNALGLKITGVDIDGDDDIDLIISDKFFHGHIGVWLNDGRGHFVKSVPGRFSPNSVSDLAFATVDLNSAGQPILDTQQRRFPDYLPDAELMPPSLLRSSTLNGHFVEWLSFTANSLHQRSPPTASAV